MYKQLEVWWIDLEPTRGAETRKKRPCVIIQSDIVNNGSKTLHINLKQLRAVDVSRISNRCGIIEGRYLPDIQNALHIVFNL